jgi:hypothetical protein
MHATWRRVGGNTVLNCTGYVVGNVARYVKGAINGEY